MTQRSRREASSGEAPGGVQMRPHMRRGVPRLAGGNAAGKPGGGGPDWFRAAGAVAWSRFETRQHARRTRALPTVHGPCDGPSALGWRGQRQAVEAAQHPRQPNVAHDDKVWLGAVAPGAAGRPPRVGVAAGGAARVPLPVGELSVAAPSYIETPGGHRLMRPSPPRPRRGSVDAGGG